MYLYLDGTPDMLVITVASYISFSVGSKLIGTLVRMYAGDPPGQEGLLFDIFVHTGAFYWMTWRGRISTFPAPKWLLLKYRHRGDPEILTHIQIKSNLQFGLFWIMPIFHPIISTNHSCSFLLWFFPTFFLNCDPYLWGDLHRSFGLNPQDLIRRNVYKRCTRIWRNFFTNLFK